MYPFAINQALYLLRLPYLHCILISKPINLHRIEQLPTMRDVTIQVLFIPNSQISISMATLQLAYFIFN